jgi:hypothetical protein
MRIHFFDLGRGCTVHGACSGLCNPSALMAGGSQNEQQAV